MKLEYAEHTDWPTGNGWMYGTLFVISHDGHRIYDWRESSFAHLGQADFRPQDFPLGSPAWAKPNAADADKLIERGILSESAVNWLRLVVHGDGVAIEAA